MPPRIVEEVWATLASRLTLGMSCMERAIPHRAELSIVDHLEEKQIGTSWVRFGGLPAGHSAWGHLDSVQAAALMSLR